MIDLRCVLSKSCSYKNLNRIKIIFLISIINLVSKVKYFQFFCNIWKSGLVTKCLNYSNFQEGKVEYFNENKI